MTTFQRLRALIQEWRTFNDFPPEIPEPARAAMKLAAYACAEDLQEVLDEIRNQRRAAGQVGGSRRSRAKTIASRRNASRLRKKAAE